MKALIFSISAGNGHKQTSLAIKNYILKNNNTAKILIVDTLNYISPFLNKLVIGSYLKTIKISPNIYKKLYNHVNNKNKTPILKLNSKISNLFSIKLKELIYTFKPSIILSTHPISTEILSILKTKFNMDIPVITIITDYTAHKFWLQSDIDAYIIGNKLMINELITMGADKNKLYPLGIPVNPNFYKKIDKKSTLEQLGLSPNIFTILIMGGSLGIGKILQVYKELNKVKNNIQILIITGKNKKLYSELVKLKSLYPKPTCILKYTNNVNEYMHSCDILLTKPGGITITEAIASSIPLIVFSAIPGQEEGNVKFLLENNIGIYLEDIKNCSNLIEHLIANQSILNKIKDNYKNYINPNCGDSIYQLISSLCKNNI